MNAIGWLTGELKELITKQTGIPSWAIEMAEAVAMPGDVNQIIDVARELVKVGGKDSPGPTWLSSSERSRLQKKYGIVAANWAEALCPPGTPIEEVEATAQYLLNKVKTALGLKSSEVKSGTNLIEEFKKLNPELQEGCLRYAQRMRERYRANF